MRHAHARVPQGAIDKSPAVLPDETVPGGGRGPDRAEPLGEDGERSYLHGHSALSRASSRHSGGEGGHARTRLNPDTVLPVYSGDRAIRSSETVARRGAPRDSVVGRR